MTKDEMAARILAWGLKWQRLALDAYDVHRADLHNPDKVHTARLAAIWAIKAYRDLEQSGEIDRDTRNNVDGITILKSAILLLEHDW
jgi:hypothetical protein